MRRTLCPAEESKGGTPRAVRDIILGRMAVDRSNACGSLFGYGISAFAAGNESVSLSDRRPRDRKVQLKKRHFRFI